MHISPKTKRNIIRIIPFGVIWLINGIIFGYVETAALGDAESPYTAIEVSSGIIIFGLISIFIVGLLVGIAEIYLLNRLLAKKSFTKKILYKVFIYTSFLFAITVILFPLAASIELKLSYFDPRVWERLLLFLTSGTNISTQIQSAVSLIQSIFYFK